VGSKGREDPSFLLPFKGREKLGSLFEGSLPLLWLG